MDFLQKLLFMMSDFRDVAQDAQSSLAVVFINLGQMVWEAGGGHHRSLLQGASRAVGLSGFLLHDEMDRF